MKLRLLALCSKNQWRSPTAEVMYRQDPRVEVRSAGTSAKAAHTVSQKDIEWAEIILCMEPKHARLLKQRFGGQTLPPIKVADIPDEYEYRDEELVELLRGEIEDLLTNKPIQR